jgi:hypothetical protein
VQVKALLLVGLAGCAVTTGMTTEPARAPAAAAAPTAAPVAAPAEATEQVAVPGGRFSRDPRTCDAANDHCLREGTWFLEKHLGKMQSLEAVFWADGAWRDWSSGLAVEGGPAHRTKPASLQDLAVGDRVVFVGNGRTPSNESEAHGGWALETVLSIDAERQTFEWGRGSHPMPIELARVIVETR